MKFHYELTDSKTKTHLNINLRWVLQSLPKPLIVAVIILALTSSFESVLNGYVMSQIIKINLSDLQSVTVFLLQALLAYAGTYLSAYGFMLLKNQATKLLNEKLKQSFFSNYFEGNYSEADVTNAITTISKQIEQRYFSSVFMLVQTALTAISTTFFILHTHFLLGSIYIGLSFLSLVPGYLGRNKLNQKADEWSKSNSSLINTVTDIFSGRTEIRNFKVRNLFFTKFKNSLSQQETNYRNMLNYQTNLMLCAWGFAILTYLGPIALGLYLAQFSNLGITISIIVALILTADSVVGSMREITNLQTAISGTKSIRKIELFRAPVNSDAVNNVADSAQNDLIVKDLEVDQENKTILKNIDFSLHEGEKALITGPSGIGKSTLLATIIGQLNPKKGQVLFNNQAINEDDFVFLAQSIWLFNGTLRDNLTLFESYKETELTQVLQEVGLLKELGKNALDLSVDSKGKNISGGQGQRLAIARGLLRQKKLFVLDEITSGLDSKNADKIHDLIYKLPVTVIESAHNFNEKQLDQYKIKKFVLSKNNLQQVENLAN